MSKEISDKILVQRVSDKFRTAGSEDQIEDVLNRFLAPVLLKIDSSQNVIKEVTKLLTRISNRIKSRSTVLLPVEDLLTQYQDPSIKDTVKNYTIIYIKLGFPRLPIEKRMELFPVVLNSLEDKSSSHKDQLLLMLLPLLGKIPVPTDPKEIPSAFGFNKKPKLSKRLLALLLDVLVLPYRASGVQAENCTEIPPGMSEQSYKRIGANLLEPDRLEEIKLGVIKFLSHGIFKTPKILLHLIVASADTRFSVVNLSETELRKIVGTVDWSSSNVCTPIYILFLGTLLNTKIKEEKRKKAVCTRIRMKLLQNLCRAKGGALVFPFCIQVVFESLNRGNTNARLQDLGLKFAVNIITSGDEKELSKLAKVLLTDGLIKYTENGEEKQKGQAYILIGLLAQKFPSIVYNDLTLLQHFFINLEKAVRDLKLQIREGFLNLILAYKYDDELKEEEKIGRLNLIFGLIKSKRNSSDAIIRFIIVRILATVFPSKHVASKLLLLQATEDSKDEISSEAYKSLYGNARKMDINLSKSTEKSNKVTLPSFTDVMRYINNEIDNQDKSEKFEIGNHLLPYSKNVFKEVLVYVRLCLIQDVNVPLLRQIMKHPCEDTPSISEYLQNVYGDPKSSDSKEFLDYLKLNRELLLADAAIEPLGCLVEAIGCLPQYSSVLIDDISRIREKLLSSTNEEIREYSAVLYGILSSILDNDQFKENIEYLIKQTDNKTLEVQHGALLALGNCFESKIRNTSIENVNEKNLVKTIHVLNNFLKNQNALLCGAACTSIGSIASCTSLPLENGKILKGSPDPKRPATELITKACVMQNLMNILCNQKLTAKLKEKAALALGLLCVGEVFPHSRDILEGLLDTAKETKDVEVHFTIGESLVMCIQSVYSPEARNKWKTPITNRAYDNNTSDENLEWLLDELLKLVKKTHPNSRQASSIWLLAIVKNCGEREPITKRLNVLQNIFMELLGEKNDIVQDVAAKGLCVFYDTYKSEQLLSALVNQLTSGSRQVQQVSSDTKLFEEGQLGAAPTGGNLTTYKELCSLASDLNKPDLIYQFMQLANHNSIWNSKKGAAFGFSSIAEKCGEDLKIFLPDIVPKLYRYQYDPSPNIQQSMLNIWRVLVSEPQKVVEKYYHEILKDLLENLNHGQYRVRQSCCMALQDFLKGSGNRTIHDALEYMGELWSKLFRVMDDHHEDTRRAANNTALVLSKLCVNACDERLRKDGYKMVDAILPTLLDPGIISNVDEIRLISLKTISQLIESSGKQVKEFLPKIIPALLKASGELESAKLSYISTRLAGSQVQEAFDEARAARVKSHTANETVSKSLQYVTEDILGDLITKIIELMQQSVGLGSRIACTHCLTQLIVQMGPKMQPYSSKLLSVLTNGLLDRNAAIRKHYAITIGYVVRSAKKSSLEKLFAQLNRLYFDREDMSVKPAIAYTIKSIGAYSQEILKQYSNILLPLIFFAMHGEKNPESESTLKIWEEIWSENTPGTESGIRQNLDNICDTIKKAMESSSWTIKAQAANTVSTVASKLGGSLDIKHQTSLIEILLNGLSGRTWNGKDKLLKALANICTNCKVSVRESSGIDKPRIVQAILRECRKDEIIYKTVSLKCLGDILSSLQIDEFDEVYNIVQSVLVESSESKDKDDDGTSVEETSKNRENKLRLKAAVYECLGKSWSSTTKDTQDKYSELFVLHCAENLPKITRNIQVSVLEALYDFVRSLKLLGEDELVEKDEKSLGIIIDNIVISLEYSLAIPKYTRLRKESLNIITLLLKELKWKPKEVDKIITMLNRAMPTLEQDTSPEIKSRMKAIKKLMN